MEFSYKPINPFKNDGLSKEDRTLIEGMRNTAYVCGYRGGDVEMAVNEALKRMDREDLLPTCERNNEDSSWMFSIFNQDKLLDKIGIWSKEAEEKGLTLDEYLKSISPLENKEESEVSDADSD